jgi:hypothetical protein
MAPVVAFPLFPRLESNFTNYSSSNLREPGPAMRGYLLVKPPTMPD